MRQARTRTGGVLLPSVKQLIHSVQIHVLVSFNGFNFVFYACPQMISDMDCESLSICDFGSAENQDDCSSNFSNCIKNEGNIAVYLPWCSIALM